MPLPLLRWCLFSKHITTNNNIPNVQLPSHLQKESDSHLYLAFVKTIYCFCLFVIVCAIFFANHHFVLFLFFFFFFLLSPVVVIRLTLRLLSFIFFSHFLSFAQNIRECTRSPQSDWWGSLCSGSGSSRWSFVQLSVLFTRFVFAIARPRTITTKWSRCTAYLRACLHRDEK